MAVLGGLCINYTLDRALSLLKNVNEEREKSFLDYK